MSFPCLTMVVPIEKIITFFNVYPENESNLFWIAWTYGCSWFFWIIWFFRVWRDSPNMWIIAICLRLNGSRWCRRWWDRWWQYWSSHWIRIRMMKTTIWPRNWMKDISTRIRFMKSHSLSVENTYAYNGYPGYLYGGIAPFDETGVTLFVPLAAGATAGLLVLQLEFSVLGCTAGATA